MLPRQAPGHMAVQHKFSEVPKAEIPRSSFDRTHGYKSTFDEGYLIPFFCDEVLPGSTKHLDATLLVRFSSALIVPIMDNLYLDTFFFFVPYRLIHTNFQKMMGEQDNPGDSVSFLTPLQTVPANPYYAVGTLADYFGLPTGVPFSVAPVAYPFRAYNLIWNQWFCDENLQNSVTVDKGDGPDTASNYVLKRRSKRHDYFTSCLPWPQKGTAVALPLSGNAPVKGIAIDNTTMAYTNAKNNSFTESYGVPGPFSPAVWDSPGASTWLAFRGDNATKTPQIYADLSSVNAATINDIRQAFQLQRLAERDARGGTRYVEILKSHFGVTSPDARLQRPEFLGGGSTPISVNPIVQMSANNAQPTPLGNLAAFSHGVARGQGFSKSFVEHGLIIGLLMVRADLSYQQGLNRMWSRRTKYDFYWPALAHLGEQSVLNKEIYAQGDANDPLVFGYQERWAEYRYKPSLITGQFRSTYSTPLDVYHLAQKFTSLPTLGDTFIQDTPPISRIVAVTSQPHFILDAYLRYKCVEPMPIYSVPGLIDHF